ncbi:MAG TPA: bifunctional metallophosphatase/5'-nucleotidase [Acidimicrobiia bacterium]
MSTGNRGRHITVLLGVAALLASLLAGPVFAKNGDASGAANSREVQLQILAINDFHGNINTFSSSFGGSGGAQNLATNIRDREAQVRNSIVVSAGDLIGASPLISALFHDEPTIEAMNLIGLDINGVGNHEFDEGPAELLRMANGGSHPVDTDLDGTPFSGADFDFLAANVVVDATGNTLFPPYTVKNYQGVRVAFIGLTLEGTPSIVTPSGVAGLTFNDEADTINAIIPHLQSRNIEAFVVLLHEGGSSPGGQNDCSGGLTGPVADITRRLDDAVDLVIAGHTNDEFICEIDGKWVTMADNAGRIFTDIDVTLNRVTKDLTVQNIENVNNLQSAPDAPDLVELIEKYDALSAPLANAVIGTITGDITRTNNAAGESALGDVIADAQLDATDDPGFGDAVVAFMNPGGIRDDLDFVAAQGAPDADGEVTYGEAFSVQPFGNSLVTMALTGKQIDTLLEQQWVGQTSPRILQVSEGFTYSWSASAADGSRVDIADIMIGGIPVDPNGTYRVTVNSFLADGGDNFFVLVQGTDRLGGEVDLDALVTYFEENSPVEPGPQDRITVMPWPEICCGARGPMDATTHSYW